MSVDTIRAVRYHGNKDVRIDKIPRPVCGAGQVALKPAFVGLCGSDVHEYVHGPMISSHQKHPLTGEAIPVTLGHEISGTIGEVGERVTNFKVGDRVVVMAHLFCGTCPPCQSDKAHLCDKIGVIGYTSEYQLWNREGKRLIELGGQNGGLSEYMVVEAENLILLPDEIPLDIGALVEPLSVSWHSVHLSSFAEGNTALVVGAGPIGVAVLLALKASKASKIIVVELVTQRKKIAAELGASHVIDPSEVDALSTIKQLTGGRGADFAFECGGVQATLDLAVSGTNLGGKITIVSMFVRPPTLGVSSLMRGERQITASVLYSKSDFQGVISAIASGRMDPRPLITSVVKMEEVVTGGIQELIDNKDKHVKILVDINA